MHNVVLIEYLEGIDELLENQKSLFLGQGSFFSESALECASVAVFVDEIEIIRCFEHVDILNYVLILLDISQNVDLVDRAFLQFFVLFKPSHLDDLDGVFLVVIFIDGSENLTVSALSDYFVKSVVLNDTHH